jgi:hypothetical protein
MGMEARAVRRLMVPAWCTALAVLAAGTAAVAAPVELSNADKQALAVLAIQWACDGGLDDFKRVPTGSDLVVADVNLPKDVKLDLPGRKVVVASLARIQAHADIKGDAVYFRLGPFTGDDLRTEVPVALLWAASVRNPAAVVTGSGALLEFEKRNGKWQRVGMTGAWTH